MTDHEHAVKRFLSILMESPLYMTLSLQERQSLLERLTRSYPSFDEEDDAGQKDNRG
ncbi:MAG: hypothetical protein P8013_10035 [Candidatus Sulfobium sp.]|jgi:hypothetical protein